MEDKNDLHKIGIFVAPSTLVIGIIIGFILYISYKKFMKKFFTFNFIKQIKL